MHIYRTHTHTHAIEYMHMHMYRTYTHIHTYNAYKDTYTHLSSVQCALPIATPLKLSVNASNFVLDVAFDLSSFLQFLTLLV